MKRSKTKRTKPEGKMTGTKPALKSSKVDSTKNKKPLFQTDLPKTQASFKEARDRYAFGKLPTKQTPHQLIKALKKMRDADLLLQLFSK